MSEDLSDEALMVAVAARQQQAFRILMGRHMPRAIRVAQRVVRDSAEADDIGQDAFLRVWSHAASFDPDIARFTTWLYRIVLNLRSTGRDGGPSCRSTRPRYQRSDPEPSSA